MNQTFRKCRLLGSLLLVLSVSCLPAGAEEGEWSYQIAPLYVWAQSTDGVAVVGDQTIPIVLDFSDAVNALDGIFTIHMEAWRGDWGLLLDYARTRLEGKHHGQLVTFNLGLDETIMEAAGGWKFGSRDLALLAGVRYYDMKLKVRFEDTILPLDPRQVGPSFTDVFAGVAWRPQLGDRWALSMRADLGTGDSDLVINANLLVSFHMTEMLELFLGYRYLDYDIAEGSGEDRFEWDVQKDGPALGLIFNF